MYKSEPNIFCTDVYLLIPQDSHMPRMVVTNQPSVNNYHNVQQVNPHPNNALLIVTVCLGFGCLVFGGYFTLCCTIPAIVFAIKVRE